MGYLREGSENSIKDKQFVGTMMFNLGTDSEMYM